MEIRYYRKKSIQPMYPWTPEVNMDGVSISDADKELGCPRPGDMIAFNAFNVDDRWLIEGSFFQRSYEEVTE
jgi:hypothetical protein